MRRPVSNGGPFALQPFCTIITAPIVTLKGNQAFANSKDVAAFFGKRHDNVLRDISDLIATAPSIALSFEAIDVPVKVGFGTRMDPAFDMTKDGFTLLAMGFTGGVRRRSLAGMDSISRYHLSAHDDNLWNVIDTATGRPVEVHDDDEQLTLSKLPRARAEAWSKLLNESARMFRHKNPSR